MHLVLFGEAVGIRENILLCGMHFCHDHLHIFIL